MYLILMSLSIVCAVLLILVVLLQSSKGGGLAGSFGGAGQFGTVFGTRRTADLMSKLTWWLGGALLVLAIVINLFFLPGKSSISQKESIIQGGGKVPAQTAPAAAPPTSSTAPIKK